MRRAVLMMTCLLWASTAHASPIVASSVTQCEYLILQQVPGSASTPCGFVLGDQVGIRFSFDAPTRVDEFDVFGIDAGVGGVIDTLSNPRLIGCPECTTEYDVAPFVDLGVTTISSQPFGFLSDGTQYFEYSIMLNTPILFPQGGNYMAILSGTNAGGAAGTIPGLLTDGGTYAVVSQCCGGGIVVHGEVVPEPSTVLLVGSVLTFAARRRRTSRD